MVAFESARGDHSFIGVYHMVKAKITWLAPSVDRDSSPAWSGDGRRVAFLRTPGLPFGRQQQGGQAGGRRGRGQGRGRNQGGQATGRQEGRNRTPGMYNADFGDGSTLALWTADPHTGAGEGMWQRPADVTTAIRGFQWAGNHIVFQGEPDNWQHMFALPINEWSEPRDLTPGEGFAEQVGLSADGSTLYYCSNVGDIDRRHLWAAPVAGGEPRQLTGNKGIETYPAPLASGRRIAVLHSSARRPLSVALVSATSGDPDVLFPVLTRFFPLREQVEPQAVILTAEDGLKFHNQVFVPRGIQPGEKRPALLFTHGGPRR